MERAYRVVQDGKKSVRSVYVTLAVGVVEVLDVLCEWMGGATYDEALEVLVLEAATTRMRAVLRSASASTTSDPGSAG